MQSSLRSSSSALASRVRVQNVLRLVRSDSNKESRNRDEVTTWQQIVQLALEDTLPA
jgi:hypothetical protein